MNTHDFQLYNIEGSTLSKKKSIIKVISEGASNGPVDVKYFLWGAIKTHKHY